MKFSFRCPACGRKVGLGSLMTAITPFFVICVGCRSSIRAKGVALPIFLVTLVIGIGLLIYMANYISTHGSIDSTSLLTSFGFIIAIEFIASVIVCNKAQIVVTKNRYKPPQK